MHTICGFDMTSAPSRQKPITYAICSLQGNRLSLLALQGLESLEALRQVLAEAKRHGGEGPLSDAQHDWIAGLDFPFGQAVEFLAAAGWPDEWETYVRHAGNLSREAYAQAIYSVMAKRPKGSKLIRRATDIAAESVSPMSLAYVPVGRMFHALAPVILESGADVFPLRMRGDSRILLEAYPALVARAIIGRDSYKEGSKQQRGLRAENRARLLQGLSAHVQETAGLELDMPQSFAETMLQDWRGDYLDALLCAVQAACASRLPEWGMPQPIGGAAAEGLHTDTQTLPRMRRTEGWILGTKLP
ncbi:DUF429 domain-containing protein [Desulfovibrio mangrovi]|uniref:DUF429 domain-containing protein n=1 Tax=Desulfovibrio mangrovi TaxID=2976983 RepID=UPI002246EF7C|nr:DUF429 domain-containing protein [Desulfovibrio mangrovi]UZP68968.1 DUF429 domain-containing protein [Desulfovibrio mangrovi]